VSQILARPILIGERDRSRFRVCTVVDMSIESILSKYPGRGLIHLVDTTGIASWAYFITGRSESSRARRITAEHGRLDVTATSESAGFDARRHYTCARPTNDGLIVGNGDHVDAIAIGLDEPRPLVEVLREPGLRR